MPLLTPEQMEAFKARIADDTPETTSAVEQDVSIPQKTEEKSYTREVQTQSQEANDEGDDGHAVPYKRFKKVIENRNQLRGEIDYLKKEIEQIKSSSSSRETNTRTDRDYERSIRQAEDEYNTALENLLDPSASKVKNLEQRMFAFEVAQEKVKLNEELKQIHDKYPEVPDQIILQAILKDPDVDAFKVAEQYSLFVSQIEEQGVARYLKSNGSSTPTPARTAPAVPQRFRGSSGATAESQNSFGGVDKPKDLRAAGSAVVQFLKNNPFNR